MGARVLDDQVDYLTKQLNAVRKELGTAREEVDRELIAAKAEVTSAKAKWLDASDTNLKHKVDLKEVWEQAMKNYDRLQEFALKKEELFQKREERVHEHLKFLEDKLNAKPPNRPW